MQNKKCVYYILLNTSLYIIFLIIETGLLSSSHINTFDPHLYLTHERLQHKVVHGKTRILAKKSPTFYKL